MNDLEAYLMDLAKRVNDRQPIKNLPTVPNTETIIEDQPDICPCCELPMNEGRCIIAHGAGSIRQRIQRDMGFAY